MNDQPVWPVVPYARLGISAKAPNTVEVWKWQEKAIAPTLTMDQPAMLLRTPGPITPGNCLLEFAIGRLTQIRDFAPLGERKLCNLLRDPIVLLQAGPAETHYTWNGTHTIERGEKVGVLVWYISPPVRLLMPEIAASPASMYGVHNQVSFLKLPLLKARGACSVFHWYNHLATVCSLCWPGGHYSTHRSPY